MRKILWGVVIVFIVGIGIAGLIKRQSQITPTKPKDVKIDVAISAQQVVQKDLSSFVEGKNQAALSAQVGGVLENIYVKEGDYVKQGQVLAHINIPDIVAKQKQAITAINIAQQEEQKARSRKTLRKRWEDLTPEAREQYKLNTQLARDLKQEVDGLMSRSYVRAPFSGVLSKKYANNGDTVFLGNKIFDIIGNPNEKEIKLEVSSIVSDGISLGDKVDITNGDITEQGNIVAIGPAIDNKSRKSTIRVALNDNTEFKLGEFVSVVFTDKTLISGVLVPKNAIVKNYEDSFVFVVDDESVVHMIKVVPIVDSGKEDKWFVEGINDGERVVISRAQHIQDGEIVNVVE